MIHIILCVLSGVCIWGFRVSFDLVPGKPLLWTATSRSTNIPHSHWSKLLLHSNCLVANRSIWQCSSSYSVHCSCSKLNLYRNHEWWVRGAAFNFPHLLLFLPFKHLTAMQVSTVQCTCSCCLFVCFFCLPLLTTIQFLLINMSTSQKVFWCWFLHTIVSVIYCLYMLDTPLRWTVGASPAGVCLRESWLY